MLKFILSIISLLCNKDKPVFTPSETHLTGSELRSKLQVLGCQIILWDKDYYYPSHEDWGKVLEDVMLNQPKYTVDKFDCENFALLTSARVSSRYQINTCGIAIGDSPLGYHGFNIFVSNKGLYYLEPQGGAVYSVTENSGYKPDLVIFG